MPDPGPSQPDRIIRHLQGVNMALHAVVWLFILALAFAFESAGVGSVFAAVLLAYALATALILIAKWINGTGPDFE